METIRTITIPRYLTRPYVEARKGYIFIYGCALHRSDKGIHLGNEAICHGLTNCFGIPVRFKNCKDESAYFTDERQEEICNDIFWAFSMLPKMPEDIRPIIAFPKIGEGWSQMKKRAPKCHAFLRKLIEINQYPHIERKDGI